MSSHAHSPRPLVDRLVCKITEDWRQQQNSALTKRQQQRSNAPLLSPVSSIASMLQHSAICLLFIIFSCSHKKHLWYTHAHTAQFISLLDTKVGTDVSRRIITWHLVYEICVAMLARYESVLIQCSADTIYKRTYCPEDVDITSCFLLPPAQISMHNQPHARVQVNNAFEN